MSTGSTWYTPEDRQRGFVLLPEDSDRNRAVNAARTVIAHDVGFGGEHMVMTRSWLATTERVVDAALAAINRTRSDT